MSQQNEPVRNDAPPIPPSPCNPWLSIWLKPQETTKYLLNLQYDSKAIWRLYWLIVVFQLISLSIRHQFGSIVLSLAVIFICTLATISFGIILLKLICKLFNNPVEDNNLSTIYIWGIITSSMIDVVYALLVYFFGQDVWIIKGLLLIASLGYFYITFKMFRVIISSRILTVLIILLMMFLDEISRRIFTTLRVMNVI